MDLRWQVDELARNLQHAFPNMPWNRRCPSRATTRCSSGQMPGLLDTLGDIDDLEHLLAVRRRSPASWPRSTSTGPASCSATTPPGRSSGCAELARMLEEAGLIEQREGRLELTPKGIRAIGQKALGDLFRKLMKDRAGRHEIERSGVGHERAYEHKPYEFGDPFHLNVEETVKNADLAPGRRARRCASRPTTSRSSAPSC